jgi:hypothetical protein
MLDNGDTITWSGALSQYQVLTAGAITQAQGDVRYVQLAGSTMTGSLVLSADPTVALSSDISST